MKQSQLFQHPSDIRHLKQDIVFTVTADAAYEIICQALMTGSPLLDALITTEGGYTVEIRVCEIAGDKETMRDVISRADRDLERDRNIMRNEDEWNPNLNDSWW